MGDAEGGQIGDRVTISFILRRFQSDLHNIKRLSIILEAICNDVYGLLVENWMIWGWLRVGAFLEPSKPAYTCHLEHHIHTDPLVSKRAIDYLTHNIRMHTSATFYQVTASYPFKPRRTLRHQPEKSLTAPSDDKFIHKVIP